MRLSFFYNLLSLFGLMWTWEMVSWSILESITVKRVAQRRVPRCSWYSFDRIACLFQLLNEIILKGFKSIIFLNSMILFDNPFWFSWLYYIDERRQIFINILQLNFCAQIKLNLSFFWDNFHHNYHYNCYKWDPKHSCWRCNPYI